MAAQLKAVATFRKRKSDHIQVTTQVVQYGSGSDRTHDTGFKVRTRNND